MGAARRAARRPCARGVCVCRAAGPQQLAQQCRRAARRCSAPACGSNGPRVARLHRSRAPAAGCWGSGGVGRALISTCWSRWHARAAAPDASRCASARRVRLHSVPSGQMCCAQVTWASSAVVQSGVNVPLLFPLVPACNQCHHRMQLVTSSGAHDQLHWNCVCARATRRILVVSSPADPAHALMSMPALSGAFGAGALASRAGKPYDI
jgi:hypothetical protein